MTGRPAQGCAVRSGWLRPCAVFGVPPGQRNGHDQRRRIRPIPQPKFGLQAGHAVIVRHLPGQPGLLAGRLPARVVAPCHGRRLIGDHGQRPRCQAAAVTLAPPAGRRGSGPTRPGSCCGPSGERLRPVVQRQGGLGAAAGDVDRQMRSGRNRDAAALGLQEDRRDAGIGGRRDPGLQFGRRRAGAQPAATASPPHKAGPAHRVLAMPRQATTASSSAYRKARGSRRASPGRGRPTCSRPIWAKRAGRMRLPERKAHAVRGRRPVGQHRQWPVDQPGAGFQPAIGGPVVRQPDADAGRGPADR